MCWTSLQSFIYFGLALFLLANFRRRNQKVAVSAVQRVNLSLFRSLSFVNTSVLETKTPGNFKQLIHQSCEDTREVLLTEWIPECAEIIRTGLQEEKEQLKTPKKKHGIEPRLEHTKYFAHGKSQMKSYFKTVATVMELQVNDRNLNSKAKNYLATKSCWKIAGRFAELLQNLRVS